MHQRLDIVIRKAGEDDLDLYFGWVNERSTRANSFKMDTINYDDHSKWFRERLNSPDFFLYVFESGSIPVGQVRVEKGEEVTINISIKESYRGRGLGKYMIEMAVDYYYNESIDDQPVLAYIKEKNLPSIQVFKKAGFSFLRKDIINKIECLVLKYQSNVK